MKSFIALALALSAAALPAAEIKARQIANVTIFFGGIAIRSGSDIQYATVAANDYKFWLHKDTATYTPPEFPSSGDAVNYTTFAKFLPVETLSLNTLVPGGQAVYVAEDGALSYTQAHSANTFGGVQTGFVVAQGHLLFEDLDFVAVPTNETTNLPGGEGTAYQVYAASRTNLTGENFAFRAESASNYTISHPVYQYN